MIQRIGRGTSVETPNLDAVPKPYRSAVEDMFDTWGDVSARNTVLKRYYEMKNEMRSLGISIPPMLEKVDCVTGWCAKAVKAHSGAQSSTASSSTARRTRTSSASCARTA